MGSSCAFIWPCGLSKFSISKFISLTSAFSLFDDSIILVDIFMVWHFSSLAWPFVSISNSMDILSLVGGISKKLQQNLLMGWESYPTALLLLLSHFSRVWLCATPLTAALQAPPSLGFSRQEHWSGLPRECKLVQPLWKAEWRFLIKLNIDLPYNLESHPWIYIQRKQKLIQKIHGPQWPQKHYLQ